VAELLLAFAALNMQSKLLPKLGWMWWQLLGNMFHHTGGQQLNGMIVL